MGQNLKLVLSEYEDELVPLDGHIRSLAIKIFSRNVTNEMHYKVCLV